MTILPLTFSNAVRSRPGMYIGGVDERALNGCIFELVANSVEQHLSGRCDLIRVTLHDDGSVSVQDDGPGIPVTVVPQHNLPFIELALTTPFRSPDLPSKRYLLSTRGVGAKCVNAVSEWMQVNSTWEAAEFQIKFASGRVSEPLRRLPEPQPTRGTTIRFKPDPTIFRNNSFDRGGLAAMLEPLAILHPGLEVWLVDERPNPTNQPIAYQYRHPNGIADFLRAISPHEREPGMQREPVIVQGENGEIKYAIGFRFTESLNTSLLSFANSIPTPLGGTHVYGFLSALTEGLNEAAGKPQHFQPHQVRTGLSAVVSMWLPDPKYAWTTKDELMNIEAQVIAREVTLKAVGRWRAEAQDVVERVIDFLDEQTCRQADVDEAH